MDAVRTIVWYAVALATIGTAALQFLTFFGIVNVQAIEQTGILPEGVAEKLFLQPYDHGRDLLVAGKYEEAVRKYEEALRAPGLSDQEKAKAYKAIGYAHLKRGDYAKADEALQRAMQLDPKAPLVHVNWIKLLCARKEDPERVRSALRHLRSFAPNYGHDDELMKLCGYAGITPDFK